MKLSTKSRYGVRMMLDLALHSSDLETLPNIAKRQDISPRYLEQVASDLRKAGFIKSLKGAKGGYLIVKEPQNISLKDLLTVMEGDVRLTDIDDDEDILQRSIRETVYDPLNERVEGILGSVTLQDMIEEYYKTNGVMMYYI